jgi:hypothetical protein
MYYSSRAFRIYFLIWVKHNKLNNIIEIHLTLIFSIVSQENMLGLRSGEVKCSLDNVFECEILVLANKK